MAQETSSPLPTSRWTSGPAIVSYLAVCKLLLHLYASGYYGYFVDELYYLACAEHLDWGYVDQPPLIAVVAALVRETLGDSLRAIRLLPAVAGAAKVLLAGALAREMGGGRFAQALAAVAVIVAPIYLGVDNFLSMNAFEPLFWMGAAWLVVRYIKTGNERLWIWFGVLSGFGLLNKYSMLWFGFGVTIALLLTPQRRVFMRPWIWMGGVIAFLIFLPNLWWQASRGFPMRELLENIRQSGRNVDLNALEFMAEQTLFMHPLTLPIWLGGLWFFLFTERGRQFRALGLTFVVVLVTLLLMDGRTYYFAPIYPMMLAGGASWIEQSKLFARRTWPRAAYLAVLAIGGAALAPLTLPILPPETYIRYAAAIGIQQPRVETHEMGPLPQLYADQFGWKEMAENVAKVYHSLPPDERAKAAIFTDNYGEAGAIDLFGPALGLPKAISGHQNYFYWGPRGYTGEVVIVLGDEPEDVAENCKSVEVAGGVEHPYSMPYQHFPIVICRGTRLPLQQLWPELKNWN